MPMPGLSAHVAPGASCGAHSHEEDIKTDIGHILYKGRTRRLRETHSRTNPSETDSMGEDKITDIKHIESAHKTTEGSVLTKNKSKVDSM
eukprot:scaffold13220_cov113-Isochrysis_galbana.AAC.2